MGKVFVHESAIVDDGAQLGEGTKVWHFSHVCRGAKLGKSCSLGQNVYVGPNVQIGEGVKIQNNVSVYEGVTLEDYVFCGPSMVFTNVKTPRSKFPRNTSDVFEKTIVGYGASIGANATIVCGCRVGAWALIAAGAVVTRDVADYAIMTGVPARQSGWACECGIPLPHPSTDELICQDCGRRYHLDGPQQLRKTDDPNT